MKKKSFLRFLIIIVIIGMSEITIAQHQHEKQNNRCSNSQLKKYLDERLESNPDLKRRMEISKAKSDQPQNRLKSSRNEPYVIPIVFHIIHNYGVENISDARVYEALEIINADYAAANGDIQDLRSEFESVKGNPNIVFKLAQIDPDGNPTTGITRHVSPLTTNGSWDNPDVKRLCSWPREKYLNIWIVRSSDGKNGSAWAYLPYQVDNEEMYDLDGIIISSWAFGAATDGYHRILTHEIGHFLNLYHTWSPWAECGDANACNEDDDVADTPNCSGYSGGYNTNYSSCGSLDMVQNYMDYSMCPVAFSKGQVARMHNALQSSISGRNNLWSEPNLKATLFTDPTPRLLCNQNQILERKENDGRFSESFTLQLLDAKFKNAGQILSPSDYSCSGLPLGLNPQISIVDSEHLQIQLLGQTANHDVSDNTGDLTFHFEQSILEAGSNPLFNTDIKLSVQFRAPYQIVYTDCEDVNISESNPWKWINLGASNADFGVWYDNGKLRIETYKKAMICETSSKNISILEHGDVISSNQNWAEGGEYPNEHDLYSATYTLWRGKTAYAAVQFPGITPEETLYAWMRLSVSEDGKAFTLLDYAFNEAPGEEIIAGQKNNTPSQSELIFSKQELSENYLLNDGSIEDSIQIILMGNNEFASNGLLNNETHYSISNLPEGLHSEIKVNTAKKAVLRLTGNAKNHENLNSCEIGLTFKKQSFTSTNIENKSFKFTLSFNDPFTIVYNDINDINISSANNWKWFSFGAENAEYGAWHFATNHLKLETYGKQAVCQANSRNISVLAFNTRIDDSNNWALPGVYPDQLDISTSTYNDWQGKTAYIGVRFRAKGYTNYGWIKAEVATDGNSWKVLEWAYNQAPNEAIYAGQTSTTTNNKLIASVQSLEESWNNDGSIDSSVIFELLGTSFVDSEYFTEGTHYRISNLPSGLQCVIRRENAQKLSLTFTGAAKNHNKVDNVSNFSIEFTQNAFVSPVVEIDGTKSIFELNFRDPFEIVYVDCDDMTVNAENPWTAFMVEGTDQEYGIWMDNGDLRFESYSKPIVCQQATTNVKPLASGYRIGSDSQYWETGGKYPNEHFIASDNYSAWPGKTAYIGFSFVNKHNFNQYGWFRIKVAADASSYKLLDYAYHQAPNHSILAGSTQAGQIPLVPDFTASKTEILQNTSIRFTDSSKNPDQITEWNWTFEGGTPQNFQGQNPPDIIYKQKGTFDVSLRITDANGKSEQITKADWITVSPAGATDYCIPDVQVAYKGLYIQKVQVDENTYESAEDSYSNYTNAKFEFTTGKTAQIKLTPNINWNNNHITVWMDWNADKIFDETNEKVLHLTNGNWNGTHLIKVPEDAVAGLTCMRIRISYYNEKLPCEPETYMGEVEDYTVNIISSATQKYCIPEMRISYPYLFITKVQVNDQTHESIEGTYSDYTSNTFNLSAGTANSIQVTPCINWSSNHISAWIDWNQDGIFDETNEKVLHLTNGNWDKAHPLNIPADATTGTTCMRVRISYYNEKSPCETETYMGEVEDYTINISKLKTGTFNENEFTTNLKEKVQVKIYPNPVSDVLTIKAPVGASIAVYDIKGRCIIQSQLTSSIASLQVRDLKSGVYLLKISTPDGIKIKRFIVR